MSTVTKLIEFIEADPLVPNGRGKFVRLTEAPDETQARVLVDWIKRSGKVPEQAVPVTAELVETLRASLKARHPAIEEKS